MTASCMPNGPLRTREARAEQFVCGAAPALLFSHGRAHAHIPCFGGEGRPVSNTHDSDTSISAM